MLSTTTEKKPYWPGEHFRVVSIASSTRRVYARPTVWHRANKKGVPAFWVVSSAVRFLASIRSDRGAGQAGRGLAAAERAPWRQLPGRRHPVRFPGLDLRRRGARVGGRDGVSEMGSGHEKRVGTQNLRTSMVLDVLECVKRSVAHHTARYAEPAPGKADDCSSPCDDGVCPSLTPS